MAGISITSQGFGLDGSPLVLDLNEASILSYNVNSNSAIITSNFTVSHNLNVNNSIYTVNTTTSNVIIANTITSNIVNTTITTANTFILGNNSLSGYNTGKNLCDNPWMLVQQRGVGPWTNISYTTDRWEMGVSASDSASSNVYFLSSVEKQQVGNENANSALYIKFTGTNSSGAYSLLAQKSEFITQFSNTTFTVSFYAKSLSGSFKVGVGSELVYNSTAPLVLPQSIFVTPTLTTNWQRYSATFTTPSLSGYTLSGTPYWQFELWLSENTNGVSTGNIGVQSGTVLITGIQIEPGFNLTLPEMYDYRRDLWNCYRYYQSYLGILVSGYNVAGSQGYSDFTLLVPMRSTPTVVLSTTGSSNISGNGVDASQAEHIRFYINSTSTGGGYIIYNMTCSAEL